MAQAWHCARPVYSVMDLGRPWISMVVIVFFCLAGGCPVSGVIQNGQGSHWGRPRVSRISPLPMGASVLPAHSW